MTAPSAPGSPALDFTAASRWPQRAAAHVLGLGLVFAVLVALPVAPTDLDRHQLPKETIVHLATWLAVLLARPRFGAGLRPAARWSLAALVAVAVASSLVAANGWLALRAAGLLISGVAAFLTARYLAGRGAADVLLSWCAAAGVIGAATGLAQAYGAESALFATTRVPGGTFGNRNFMAHYAAVSLPLLLMGVLAARRAVAAGAATIGAAALITAIVLSRSRAAWIGAAAGCAVFLLGCLMARRRHALPPLGARPALAVAAAIAAIAIAIAVPNRLAWRSASPYSDTLIGLANHDEGSGRGRVLQYRNSIRLAMRHPVLGVGPGNWSIRYADVAPPNDPSWVYGDVIPLNPWPSSDWMALLSELGPAAVAAALLFGAALAWRALVASRSGGERVIAGSALLAVLVTTFVAGNFDAVLLLPAPLLLVAIAAAALLQRGEGGSPMIDDLAPAQSPRWALVVPLILALVTLRSALQTTAYVVAGSGRSLTRLSWAARIDPGSYPLRIALAQRLSCGEARRDIVAAAEMAPNWPASVAAERRCGVRLSSILSRTR